MSDRTQDLKNLRQVAVKCKEYTDSEIAKSEEKMKWYMGEYSVSTSDDNTSASSKTVPANATRCKIKRIYGLTQKLNPTTASDSTSVSVKTLPSTVYDLDVSKVEGNSKKSENLIVLNDVAETTTSGVTYKIENGVITLLSGTATSSIKIATTSINVVSGMSLSAFNDKSLSGLTVQLRNNDVWVEDIYLNAINKTGTFANAGNSLNIGIANGTTISSPITIKPMLVSGSTAPTEFKVGYTGIHNFAWTGVKVEGVNVWDEQTENGALVDGGTIDTSLSTRLTTSYIPVKPGTTYYFSTPMLHGRVAFYDANKNFISYNFDGLDYQENLISSGVYYVRVTFPSAYGSTYQNNCCVIISNSSRNGNYYPYTSTIKAIDLSSILYNGSPLFEGNSLKAVNDVKDSITPYKAVNKIQRNVYNGSESRATAFILYKC